jgi:2-methylcitrate dehydratase PrpD
MPDRNGTAEIASFVARTRFEDLPEDVVHHVWRSVVDCLAVALGGLEHPSLAMYLTLADTLGGHEQARIWGTPRKASVNLAALINGHLAHLLDFDDSYMPEVTILHGNAPIIPAAMALGEYLGANGREFALAFALGFEVAARAALAAGKSLYDHHFHVTAVMGPVGAAVAAGKLLGLDAQRLQWAIGIACSQSGGLGQAHGSMTKAFHAGRGAHAGVIAALLAKEGFTSGPDPLSGPNSLPCCSRRIRTLMACWRISARVGSCVRRPSKPTPAASCSSRSWMAWLLCVKS